ncbi:MAG: hypothetical protein WA945_05375 [Arcobacteraceae bacterium]
MSDIKKELKQIIAETMIPETEDYLEELHENITEENKESIRDMESFLVELQNILLAIEENKITDDEAQEVYDKITAMLDEHEEH